MEVLLTDSRNWKLPGTSLNEEVGSGLFAAAMTSNRQFPVPAQNRQIQGMCHENFSLSCLALLFCVGILTSCREEAATDKPVIYLYPEEELQVTVKLDYSGELTCTYPYYSDGWEVTALPNGTLTAADGQSFNYLYWEGVDHTDYDLSTGFCVAGSDTAPFLETALSRLGLTRKEANEFIFYWLPQIQKNPYNLITLSPSRPMPIQPRHSYPLIRLRTR